LMAAVIRCSTEFKWTTCKERQSQHFVFKILPPTLWLVSTIPNNCCQ
jgi:hypothetical protein